MRLPLTEKHRIGCALHDQAMESLVRNFPGGGHYIGTMTGEKRHELLWYAIASKHRYYVQAATLSQLEEKIRTRVRTIKGVDI
jgi:hypothetical protein